MERTPKLPLAAALENAYNYPPGMLLHGRRFRVNNSNTRKLLAMRAKEKANAKKLSGTKRKHKQAFNRNNNYNNHNIHTHGTKHPKLNLSYFNDPNNNDNNITTDMLIDKFREITSKFPEGTRYGIKYHTNNTNKVTYSTQIAPNHFPFILIRLPRKWKRVMEEHRPGIAINNGM
jgi:hypothetical protein